VLPLSAFEQQISTAMLSGSRNVKLADLADNLANNYRLNPSLDVTARIDRYQRAIQRLQAVPGQVPRSHT
jgi:hypothetical protein